MILIILYSEVSSMLPAKYQPNRPVRSGVEVIWMVLTIYGHGGHLEFQIMTHFSLIGTVVLEKKSFERFLPYMGMAAILNLETIFFS